MKAFYHENYPDNYEPKFAVTFVLDISSSMRGEGIHQLNQGIKAFESFFLEDPVAMARIEVCVVTFGNDISVERKFSAMVTTPFPKFKAGGKTLMKQGLESAIRMVNTRKAWFKTMGLQYYRPYIILITDGSPWPDKSMDDLPDYILKQIEDKRFIFQAFGAGKANFNVLERLSHPDFPPKKIDGYNFLDFFRWLAPNISTMVSQPINN
mgnify:CR=1 FL=1